MSKEFRERENLDSLGLTTPAYMREWCQRPGARLPDGKMEYYTEQDHKDTCDINKIIRKYDKTGLITHISSMEAKFGDLTGMEFKAMQDKVAGAKSMFEALPGKIKQRFDYMPEKLLEFMDDPKNRPEAIELGLINKDWAEEVDGIGEHVKNPQPPRTIPADAYEQEKVPANAG